GAGLGTSSTSRAGARAEPRHDSGDGPDAEADADSSPSLPDTLVTRAPISWVAGLFERRPFEEGTFEVEGLRLQYERHGEGTRVLVFLHGLLLDNQLSRRLAADLAER